MPLPEPVIRLLAGSGAADRTHERRIQKQYAGSDEDLKQKTEVTREVVACPPRTVSTLADPLPLRKPPRKMPQLEPDPALVRKYKGLLPEDPEEGLPKRPPFDMPPDISAADTTQDEIRKAYIAHNGRDANDFDGDLPALPEMEGFGKYRMAKNASDEHRISHLRRTTSELTPPMVEQIARLNLVDARLLREAATRAASPTGSYHSSSSAPTQRSQPLEYIDSRRGSLVQRGFSPSTPSSVSSSMNEDRMLHRRKDSCVLASSLGSDGEPNNPRKKSRQASLPISEPEPSPLDTINEDTTSSEKLPKKSRQLQPFEIGPGESAVASDGEEDWADETGLATGPRRTSAISEGLSRTRRRSGLSKPPLTQSPPYSTEDIKPRQVSRGVIDRGRQMRQPTRAAMRRAASPKRFANCRLRFEERPTSSDLVEEEKLAKSPGAGRTKHFRASPNGQNLATFASTWETTDSDVTGSRAAGVDTKGEVKTSESIKIPCEKPDRAPESDSGSEAEDAPADLALFMVEGRTTNNHDDDQVSSHSNSTTKTDVPWHRQVYNVLTMRTRRDRSATAVHQPPTTPKSEMTEKNTNEAAD